VGRLYYVAGTWFILTLAVCIDEHLCIDMASYPDVWLVLSSVMGSRQ